MSPRDSADDYLLLAKHVAEGSWSSRDLSVSLDPDKQRAALQSLLLELKSISDSDNDIDFIRDETVESLTTSLDIYDSWQQMPAPPTFSEQFLSSFTHTMLGDLQSVADGIREVETRNEYLRSSAKRMVAAQQRLNAARLMLPRVASRHAGSPVAAAGQLSIDVDQSWPDYDSAWITLTNTTPTTLHNCLVVIDIEGQKESKTHVHFVTQWEHGQPVYCHYSRGVWVEVLDERVLAEMPPLIESVSVDLYCDELRIASVEHAHDVEQRDKDIQRHFDDISFSYAYRPFQSGLLQSTPPALVCRFRGCPKLMGGTLTATLPDGRSSTASYLFWDEGELLEIPFTGLRGLPERITLTLTHAGTELKLRRELSNIPD